MELYLFKIETDPRWCRFVFSFPLHHGNIERLGGWSVEGWDGVCFHSFFLPDICLTIKAFAGHSIHVSISGIMFYRVLGEATVPNPQQQKFWPKHIPFAVQKSLVI